LAWLLKTTVGKLLAAAVVLVTTLLAGIVIGINIGIEMERNASAPTATATPTQTSATATPQPPTDTPALTWELEIAPPRIETTANETTHIELNLRLSRPVTGHTLHFELPDSFGQVTPASYPLDPGETEFRISLDYEAGPIGGENRIAIRLRNAEGLAVQWRGLAVVIDGPAPTLTPSLMPTRTPPPTRRVTEKPTPTASRTPSPTRRATEAPTSTASRTRTPAPTATPTDSDIPSWDLPTPSPVLLPQFATTPEHI
jgi:hypothetical protein